MNYPDTMLSIYDGYLVVMKNNFVLAAENNTDGVHDLRVSLKRIRAFYRLVESLNDRFDTKSNFKVFKKIARNTGMLRDSHVQLELAAAYSAEMGQNLASYISFIEGVEQDSLTAFREFVDKNPLNKIKHSEKNVKNALQSLTPVWAETKANGCMHNLHNQLILMSREDNPTGEYLHNIRKLTKTIHYIHDIVVESFDNIKQNDTFRDRIISIHKLLGKWHDFTVSINFLDRYLQDTEFPDDHKTYPQFKQYLTDNQTALRKDSIQTLNLFNEEFKTE